MLCAIAVTMDSIITNAGRLPLRWVNCRKLTTSSRAAVLRVERGEEGLRVLLLLEYVRSDVAAGEGLPELHTRGLCSEQQQVSALFGRSTPGKRRSGK